MNNPWEKTACATCGADALQETQRCNPCWEVERRLEWYLTTANGLTRILEEIKNAGLSTDAYGPLLVNSVKKALQEEENGT